MKQFFIDVGDRIKKTILVTLKPSFLTWVLVTIIVIKGWIKLDNFSEYAIFTGAMIGIKSWEKIKSNGG